MRSKWTVVSGVVGIIALSLTVTFFLIGRSAEKKGILVELVSRSILVGADMGKLDSPLKLLYDGTEIPNYAVVQVRVSNTGGQPIRSTEYEAPIRLLFRNVDRVLSAGKASSDPAELDVPLVLDGAAVVAPSILMNPGDCYVVDARVVPHDGEMPTIQATGRVVGVKSIVYRETLGKASGERGLPSGWALATSILLGVTLLMTIMTSISALGLWRHKT